MTHTHLTTPTRFVNIGGTQFAYRRWGNAAAEQPPLLMLQHYRGGMDHWGPLMTDGLAENRKSSSTTVVALRPPRGRRARASRTNESTSAESAVTTKEKP